MTSKIEDYLQSELKAEPIKVCVAVATARDWRARFGMAFASLCVISISKGIDVSPAIVHQAYIHEARNMLVRMSIEAKANYTLFLDDDMEFPPETLIRLLAHKKDIVGAVYGTRSPPHLATGRTLFAGQPVPTDGSLSRMDFLPTGILLVKNNVFKKMTSPWFRYAWSEKEVNKEHNPDGMIGEDVLFCRNARKLGYTIWCDWKLSFEVGHIAETTIMLKP